MNLKRMTIAATMAVLSTATVVSWQAGGPTHLLDLLRPQAVEAQFDGPPIEEDCRDNEIGPHGYDENKQLFWGETHLHTGYSLDAYSFGTRTTPAQAYLYAKGDADIAIDPQRTSYEPVVPFTSVARPSAPLDFVAITDHSEFLSVVEACAARDRFSPFYDGPICQRVRSLDPETQTGIFNTMGQITGDLCKGNARLAACLVEQWSAWMAIRNAAQVANQKCHFTAFVAYEWSAVLPGSGGQATNHRNVIFANNNVPSLPFSFATQKTPPELWNALDSSCRGTCQAVTIPHNINLSGGLSLEGWDGSDRTRRLQQKYQVAAEIYQHKGASECLYDPNAASPEEECAFEQLADEANRVDITAKSFVRDALGRGLAASLQSPLRNAYRLGFVGGTDGHNGAPGNVEEHTWGGHDAGEDNTPYRRLIRSRTNPSTGDPIVHTDWGPGGITGVWAQENSRAAIFAAIQRRETYATSGPRLRVRVLQTTNGAACTDPDYPGSVVPGATPMGGTFGPARLGVAPAPTFMLGVFPPLATQALVRLADEPDAADRMGRALLERVQIIKISAYMTGAGPVVIPHEPVDLIGGSASAGVVYSDVDPAVGGCLMWTDPDFDRTDAALYYVRVLQEPTFRWSYKDCVALVGTPEGVARGLTEQTCKDDPRNVVNERAWTSPIWFEPGNAARR